MWAGVGVGWGAWDAIDGTRCCSIEPAPPNAHHGDIGGFPDDLKAEITAAVNKRVLGGMGSDDMGSSRRQDLGLSLWFALL